MEMWRNVLSEWPEDTLTLCCIMSESRGNGICALVQIFSFWAAVIHHHRTQSMSLTLQWLFMNHKLFTMTVNLYSFTFYYVAYINRTRVFLCQYVNKSPAGEHIHISVLVNALSFDTPLPHVWTDIAEDIQKKTKHERGRERKVSSNRAFMEWCIVWALVNNIFF